MTTLARLVFVYAVLAAAGLAAPRPVPLRALLVIGGCCHDYAAQKDLLKLGIEARANVVVDLAYTPSTNKDARFAQYERADWAKGYDVIIHDECTSAAVGAGRDGRLHGRKEMAADFGAGTAAGGTIYTISSQGIQVRSGDLRLTLEEFLAAPARPCLSATPQSGPNAGRCLDRPR